MPDKLSRKFAFSDDYFDKTKGVTITFILEICLNKRFMSITSDVLLARMLKNSK